VLKNTKIFQSGEKCEDFSSQNGEKCKDSSKWSCCNGRPAQVENTKILKWRKIQRFFKSGEKYKDFPKW